MSGDRGDQSKYRMSLDDLEQSAHIPLEDQVEEQPTDAHHDALEPEELDRLRLLGTTGAGRLRPRS